MEVFLGIIAIAAVWYAIKQFNAASNKPRMTITVTSASDETDDDSFDDKDNWEGFNYYQSVVVPATGRYRIKYTDQLGKKTEREISVKRVYDDRGMYAINAHCVMRNANRSFLNERIQSAINLETGEVVSDVARDAIQQFAASSEGIAYEHERVAMAEIGKEWSGICILMYVAKADGQMVKKERAIIAEDKLKGSALNNLLSDLYLNKTNNMMKNKTKLTPLTLTGLTVDGAA